MRKKQAMTEDGIVEEFVRAGVPLAGDTAAYGVCSKLKIKE